jgi:hypothetical protein
MLSTRGLDWVQVRSTRAVFSVAVWGALVTSCGNPVRQGSEETAGGPPALGSSAAAQLPGGAGGRAPSAVDNAGAGSGGQLALPTDNAGSGSATGDAGAGNPVDPNHYPGHGFVVHEWGTDTIVVGSDGSLQRGLHHEEEDLPPFVYDRLKAGTLIGSKESPSVTIKMETPVTYFYSPTPVLVNAHVDFPKGVLTQWYPGVTKFFPVVAAAGSVVHSSSPAALMDPALDPSFHFLGEFCTGKYGAIAGGSLDWGDFSVQARGAVPEKAPPDAPLAQFGWSYARAVDANLLSMPNGESERFLFYRGLGDFDLPVKVEAGDGEKIKFTNGYSEPVGHAFLLNVSPDHGAFVEHATGIAQSGTLVDSVPSLQGALAIDEYVARLSEAMTKALDATGLYHDEAVAMVNTWRRQWFRTPGIRALYLLPQSWTDQSIPLTISPKPDATVRVMLIRVEVITQAQEAADVAALSTFDTDAPSAAGYFSNLGRFAEPRLRRALQLAGSAAGENYLSQIASAKSNVMSGE